MPNMLRVCEISALGGEEVCTVAGNWLSASVIHHIILTTVLTIR